MHPHLVTPGAMDAPEVESVTADSATLQWSPPKDDGGSEITDYVIEKKDKFSPRWNKVAEVPADQTALKVDKLKEGDEYQFRVTPKNKAGEGGPSSPVTAVPKAPYSKDSLFCSNCLIFVAYFLSVGTTVLVK